MQEGKRRTEEFSDTEYVTREINTNINFSHIISRFEVPAVCEYNVNRWITVNTTTNLIIYLAMGLATTCFGASWWPSSGCALIKAN